MKRVFLISFLFISIISIGQNETNKMLWNGLGLKMGLSKKIRLDVEQQLRSHHNFKEFRNTFTEIAINYFPLKNLRLNANYRYMIWEISGEKTIRNRYVVEANYSVKPQRSKFYFHVRQRYQAFVWQESKSKSTSLRSFFYCWL